MEAERPGGGATPVKSGLDLRGGEPAAETFDSPMPIKHGAIFLPARNPVAVERDGSLFQLIQQWDV